MSQAKRRLRNMQWKEISYVTRAANNRTFAIVKSADFNNNDELPEGGVKIMNIDEKMKADWEAKIKKATEESMKALGEITEIKSKMETGTKETKESVTKTFDEKMSEARKNLEQKVETSDTEIVKKLDALADVVLQNSQMIKKLYEDMPNQTIRKSVVLSPKTKSGVLKDPWDQINKIMDEYNNPNFKDAMIKDPKKAQEFAHLVLQGIYGTNR